MIIVGALATLYSFLYCSGSLTALGKHAVLQAGNFVGDFDKYIMDETKYGALLFMDIQSFNNVLMYCGIVMIVLAVFLYITACNKRRNYYVTNYIAIGACAGGNVVMSLILMIMNASWKAKFLNVDFDAWEKFWVEEEVTAGKELVHDVSNSTLWFDVGFAVYAIVIVASLLLIFNLIWKILLMKGEKKLLAGNQLAGGETV